ncbi:hypothetical protein EI94DRAFT_1762374 [Lactarius quietus]|nr:hypothetical protein EI94DRAFT_1762374 [Lactarius quietus]
MWIISGPFDGEALNEVAFQKSKLLKSGKSYHVGRKDCDLVVNHKKVSHDHGQFVVGGFSPDDVTNTEYVPTLQILNSKNKTMRIWREGCLDGVIVNPGATLQLQHDDRVDIVSGLPLTVQWQRICCFETAGKVRTPIPIDGCASLGVHVVRTMHPDITHHLVPSHAITPAHMTSLLSAAHLVKPEWLSELLELSILDPRESPRALERTFALPPESRFRPGFAAALPSALKTLRSWEPNEARLNMLKGYRFIFAGEKGLELPAGYRDVVKRGGAEYEAFSLNAGVVRWRKALVRAKALAEEKNAKVVLVADGGAMELAVGADEWDEIASVAKSLELEFILPENILQAVAYVDTFYVDSAATPADSQKQSSGETPLPDIVPNTMSAEPSSASYGRTSRSQTLNPAHKHPNFLHLQLCLRVGAAPQVAEAPLPRRLPPRRATKRATTPLELEEEAVVAASAQAAPEASQLPTPVSQIRKLPPRRRGNIGLDKFKALFDASNPDRAPSDTQTQTGVTPVTAGILSAVPEEQESQGRRSRVDDDDAEMADGSADTGENREQTLGANVVQHSVPATQHDPNSASQQNTGVAAATTGGNRAAKPPSSAAKSSTNKLDTDENFLKAVNSMKRGKKHEDEFDREFNQLRITNPKAKKKKDKTQTQPWESIDDFGDVGLRGNFMVVVEMDVLRGSAKPALTARNRDDGNSEWVGKPNFKKFKTRRPTVELVVSEENDYGIGNVRASGSQSHSESQDITARTRHFRQQVQAAVKAIENDGGSGPRKTGAYEPEDEYESIDLNIDASSAPAPRATRNKSGARATASPTKSKKPASKATPKKSKRQRQKQKASAALRHAGAADFDASDGGDSALGGVMTSTLRSTAGTQVRRTAARAAKRPVAW